MSAIDTSPLVAELQRYIAVFGEGERACDTRARLAAAAVDALVPLLDALEEAERVRDAAQADARRSRTGAEEPS